MCLVLEWFTGFLERFIALVLSQYIIEFDKWISKSWSVCCIYSTWVQARAADIYSASHVDSETQFCFLLNQETSDFPIKWHVPLVLFLSVREPPKSASLYDTNSNGHYFG